MSTRMPHLTELDAAMAYARAWNKLDCTEFAELLSPDATYATQWVFEELQGKAAIADYLEGKMETVRKSSSSVCAELATTSNPNRHCVILGQDKEEAVSAIVLFESRGQQSHGSICVCRNCFRSCEVDGIPAPIDGDGTFSPTAH